MKPVRDFLRDILERDISEIANLPALSRHAAHLFRLLYRVARRFVADQCIQRASALAYATLLAIVPLAALGFSVFASFQAFDQLAARMRKAMLEYLLPTSQQVVEQYLGTIADKTTALSVFGIIGLLLTVTALLNTVEEAFNDIWRISRSRPWLSKFIIFWSTLTLAPILIGASLTITSYFAALPLFAHVAKGADLISHTPFLLPWLMNTVALTLVYMVLPNTSVPMRFALIGGAVAGALFETSKLGFTFYVTDVANYEKVYGALSTLPIFLIWLYLSWVIVLVGAEIVFCLQHPEQSHRRQSLYNRPGVRQFFAHLILLRAAQKLEHGEPLTMRELIDETQVPDNILQEWLDELTRSGLLHPVYENHAAPKGWVPGRDVHALSLEAIHEKLNTRTMEVPDEWKDTALGRILQGVHFRLRREQHQILGQISLFDLVRRQEEDSVGGDTCKHES